MLYKLISLSSLSSDPFYASALTAYLATFDFAHDPLDIALRKFLMEASLPTETQQIDRVMEAFAIRYNSCNPGLFVSSDTPYVLAFSLVMLSTDQFNPSNKSKMSKADYVRNTKIDGVATEVLEVRLRRRALLVGQTADRVSHHSTSSTRLL